MSWWTTILWRECGSKQVISWTACRNLDSFHTSSMSSSTYIRKYAIWNLMCRWRAKCLTSVSSWRKGQFELKPGQLRLFQFSNLMKRWWMKAVGWDTFMSSQLTSNHSVICSYSKIMIVASILVSKVNIFIQMKWFWSRLSQLRFCFISKRW